jgi:hypothetical protein
MRIFFTILSILVGDWQGDGGLSALLRIHLATFHGQSLSHFQIFLTVAGNPHPDTGHPSARASRFLVVRGSRKRNLDPYPADRMKTWPISARVNSPKNNAAETIVPVEVQSLSRSENSPQQL